MPENQLIKKGSYLPNSENLFIQL